MEPKNTFEQFWNDFAVENNNSSSFSVSKEIGDSIIKFRQSMNLSQSEFAELVNIPQPVLSKIEKGIGNPTAKRLQQIVDGTNSKIEIHFKKKE